MNNFYIKTFSKAIIIAILLQSYHAQAVNFPWYKNHYHRLNGTDYRSNCLIIHIAQKIRGCGLFAYHRAQYSKDHLDQAMNVIQGRLKAFESWIIELEHEALLEIKKKYQVSDEIWQKYLTDIQHIKAVHKDQMLNNHPEITHDPNVPADIMNILIPLLKQNKINPQSINIKMISDKDEISKKTSTLAQAVSYVGAIKDEDTNTLTLFPSYIPANIEIFPRVNNLSLSEKFSICAHEIEHLVQLHSATTVLLEQYLEHYCGVSTKPFKKTPEYRALKEIHEAQAEILSSLKNPTIAHHMTLMRRKDFYPKCLYQEHFIHLSTIDMLWKVNAWLEFFHQNGFIKKKDEWLTKIQRCLKS